MNMEFTEVLISLVRQHPCLYDCRIKDFKNTSMKDRVWEQIAMQLDQNSNSVRTKWKNLKDGFAKYKKKKNKYDNWVWGPYLNFLDGAAAIRMKIPPGAPGHSPNNAESEEIKPELSMCSTEDNDVDNSTQNNNSLQEFLSLRDPLSGMSRKRRLSDEEYTDDKLSLQYNNIEEKDSIDLLFESYAKSLKQMKPRTQASVKIRLAQIFADAELEEFSRNESQRNPVPVYNTESQSQRNPAPVVQVFSMLNSTNDNEPFPSNSGFDNDIKPE